MFIYGETHVSFGLFFGPSSDLDFAALELGESWELLRTSPLGIFFLHYRTSRRFEGASETHP